MNPNMNPQMMNQMQNGPPMGPGTHGPPGSHGPGPMGGPMGQMPGQMPMTSQPGMNPMGNQPGQQNMLSMGQHPIHQVQQQTNPQATNQQTPQQDQEKNRFIAELEFVQCLANPNYICFLAQNGYFKKPEFINYMEYLKVNICKIQRLFIVFFSIGRNQSMLN